MALEPISSWLTMVDFGSVPLHIETENQTKLYHITKSNPNTLLSDVNWQNRAKKIDK